MKTSPAIADRSSMISRYQQWSITGGEPDQELLEYFGGVAPDELSVSTKPANSPKIADNFLS